MKASFTNPLALRPPIAHRRKRFLKIAQSQGCTCVKCCTSRHVAIPVARWLERWKQETASSSALPTPCSVSKKKKKKKFAQVSNPRTPAVARDLGADPRQVPRGAAAAAELPTTAWVKGFQ